MKKGIVKTLLGVLALLIGSAGAVDIAGILETGNASVQIDSITWYININPAPLTEYTPEWGGTPRTMDTFQFEAKVGWPDWAKIFYRVNGIPSNLIIPAPLLPDTWYDLPAYDFQSTRVRFEDTVLVGLSAPKSPITLRELRISPNPLTTSRLLNISGLTGETNITLDFYTTSGTRVTSFLINNGKKAVTLNLSRLARGVYLLHIHNNHLSHREKLLLID